MARPNPTYTAGMRKAVVPTLGDVEVPNASGVSTENLEQANAMPEVSMSPNDGSNPPAVKAADFAGGKDLRSFENSPAANPFPAMPGTAPSKGAKNGA